VLSQNDELLYQFLLQMREKQPQTTVAELLDVMCLWIIPTIEEMDSREHVTLRNFEPWLSREKSRLAWMDRTRS